MRTLAGLSPIANQYDGFIVDLWGVVHDGITPYPAALDCLARLAPRPVLLLSNAPRRAASAQAMLRRMGVSDHLYTHILTSGEATWMALANRTLPGADPWFARLGDRVYHLGPLRDRNVLEGLNLTLAHTPADADFLLNTGPDDDRDPTALEPFLPELDACLAANLPMICANPDLVVMRGATRLLCAGSLAAYYVAQGGEMTALGKPDPAIYATALSMMALPPGRVLAIGDSLHTDIAGAVGAGLDSAWVLGGIHHATLGHDPALAAAQAQARNLAPTYCLPGLAWD